MPNSDSRNKIILFFLYPFAAFLYALRDIKSNSSYFVFAGFCLLFGITFVAENEAADSFRYVNDFNMFAQNPVHNLNAVVHEYLYDSNSYIKDLYIYFMYYLSAELGGNNYHILFFLFAIVFTFFSLKSMQFVTENRNFQNSIFMLLLLFLFAYSNSIYNINGVRFWTASWVAVFGTLSYLITKNQGCILLILLTPLIHGSFVVFWAFFLASYILKGNLKLLTYGFVISFFLGDFAYNFLGDITSYLPTYLQNMVWAYTESDTAIAKMEGSGDYATPLYAKILNSLPRYFIMLLIVLLIRERKQIINNIKSKRVFGFLLAYQSMVNLCIIIPSMARFDKLSIPLVVYTWVNSYDTMKKYNKVLYAIPIVYAYSLRYWFKYMYAATDPYLCLSNAFHLFFKNII